MKFLGNFWNFFDNVLEIFKKFFTQDFFGGIFWWNVLEEIFGRIFLVGLLVGFFRRTIGRIFWEEFFGRNYLFTLE